jgi:hypothetical protein
MPCRTYTYRRIAQPGQPREAESGADLASVKAGTAGPQDGLEARSPQKVDSASRRPATKLLCLDVATGGVNLAEIYELERVGTAREARSHCVVVVLESDAPLRAARATDFVVVFRHDRKVFRPCDN